MQIPVLIYHKIDFLPSDVRIRGAFTSPHRFAKQIAYLKKKEFDFHTVSELVNFYKNNGKFPPKGIALTFDDGWEDNYTNAFPVLQKFGVKATIFLVSSCIGQTSAKVTPEGEGARAHLSQMQILEMSQYGIEFGSHSSNHKLFNRISTEEIELEVRESKSYIENLLQKECSVFAYPAGFYTEAAKKIIKNSGYNAAFSTVYGANDDIDLYAINRVEILRRDGYPFQFAKKIKSL